jgi:hypothetical protein
MTTPQPTQYVMRITRIHIVPEGEPLFSEHATTAEIVNESGGEFIKIEQIDGHTDHAKSILVNDEDEWDAISAAVADLFAETKKHQTEKP